MAEAKKKKPEAKKSGKYKITKSNGRVIYRASEFVGKERLGTMKAKGWKVEEV